MHKIRYILRPNDYAVFEEINLDQFTLQSLIGTNYEVTEFNTYSYDDLIGYGFIECQMEELQDIAEKREQWSAFTLWSGRPDGHGGTKGGTMEEFLARKK